MISSPLFALTGMAALTATAFAQQPGPASPSGTVEQPIQYSPSGQAASQKSPRTQIVLPVEKLESFLSNLENYKEPPIREKAVKSKASSKPKAHTTYRVKIGDTLATIASKLDLTESQLKAWNPTAEMGIRVGQKLRVQPN